MDDEGRKAKQRAAQARARAAQAAGAPTKAEQKKRKRERAEGKKGGAKVAKGAAPDAGDKSAEKKSGGAKWREKEYAGKGRNEFKKKREIDPDAVGRRKHDLVIIPIFWRTRPEEEAAVCEEAERVKRLLRSACDTLDIWVDRTHKKSPGQKLAFWEDVGVRYRIELGPSDARKKECVVSRGGSDGYASATKMHDISSVKRHVLVGALRELGLEKIDSVEEDATLDAENDKEAEAHITKWATGEEQPRVPGGPDARPRAPLKIDTAAKPANKKITFGNDDEEVDGFYAVNDDEDDEDDDA